MMLLKYLCSSKWKDWGGLESGAGERSFLEEYSLNLTAYDEIEDEEFECEDDWEDKGEEWGIDEEWPPLPPWPMFKILVDLTEGKEEWEERVEEWNEEELEVPAALGVI